MMPDDCHQSDLFDFLPPESMDHCQCVAEINRLMGLLGTGLHGTGGGPSEANIAQRVYALTRRLRRLQIGLLGAAPTAEDIHTIDRRKS